MSLSNVPRPSSGGPRPPSSRPAWLSYMGPREWASWTGSQHSTVHTPFFPSHGRNAYDIFSNKLHPSLACRQRDLKTGEFTTKCNCLKSVINDAVDQMTHARSYQYSSSKPITRLVRSLILVQTTLQSHTHCKHRLECQASIIWIMNSLTEQQCGPLVTGNINSRCWNALLS